MIMQWIIALDRHVQSLPERQRARVGKTFVSLSLSSSLLPFLSPSPPLLFVRSSWKAACKVTVCVCWRKML